MRLFTFAILAFLGFSLSTQAQSNINLNPSDPAAMISNVKSLSVKQRDSILHAIDTMKIENMPVDLAGTGLGAAIEAELIKELRATVKEMFDFLAPYLKKPDNEAALVKIYDSGYRLGAFVKKVTYEMAVKDLKDEFAGDEFANETEKAAAQKELDADIADEKKTLEEELKELKATMEAAKAEFLKTAKKA